MATRRRTTPQRSRQEVDDEIHDYDDQIDTAALARANTLVKVMRVVFTVLGVLLLMAALLGATQKPGAQLALQFSLPVFILLGTYFFRGQPFGWSLAFAILLTLNLLLFVFLASQLPEGSDPVLQFARTIAWTMIGLYATFAVATWVATFMFKPVDRLLQEHGGAAAARSFRGNRRRYEEGTAGATGEARAFKEFQATSKKVLLMGGAAVIILWGLVFGMAWLGEKLEASDREAAREHRKTEAEKAQAYLEKAKGEHQKIRQRFAAAWKESDRATIRSMLMEQAADKDMARLDRSLARFNFKPEELPPLRNQRDKWSHRAELPKVFSYWSVTGSRDKNGNKAKLSTQWRYLSGAWVLFSVRLVKTSRD